MRSLAALENKMMPAPAVETKYRVPTGELDVAVFARVLDAGTHGRVPVLDLRTWKRSPAEVGEDSFVPTAAGVTLQSQYAPALILAVAKAAGLVVTIAPAAVDQADGLAA